MYKADLSDLKVVKARTELKNWEMLSDASWKQSFMDFNLTQST